MTAEEVLTELIDAVNHARDAQTERNLKAVYAAVAALYEERQWRKTKDERPADGQLIAYYFDPSGRICVGKYEEKYDTVAGRAGFTTMTPEVPLWFALPPVPEGQ
jgi:hypothetical protein